MGYWGDCGFEGKRVELTTFARGFKVTTVLYNTNPMQYAGDARLGRHINKGYWRTHYEETT